MLKDALRGASVRTTVSAKGPITHLLSVMTCPCSALMPTDFKCSTSQTVPEMCKQEQISHNCMTSLYMSADLRRQWYEQGKTRAVARAEKREQAFRRQEAFVQRAKQLRELRQGAQQAKYAKQQKRLLAEKVPIILTPSMQQSPLSSHWLLAIN